MRTLLLIALLLPASATAQTGARGNTGRGNVPTANGSFAPEQIVSPAVPMLEGTPHAVRVGMTVYVSAMVPVDSAGRLVGPNDLDAQTRQVLTNLAAVMKAAHGVTGDVVRATIYIRELTPEAVTKVRTAVLAALDKASPPALTIIGVSALPEPSMKVMIDATAQLRGEFPDRTRMKP